MAYDFLGLVNDINRRLNEVELSSTNFATAVGFYSTAKEAVNSAIRQINYEQFEWPFNHVSKEEVLSANVTRYAFPNDTKTLDMDTFRIKANASLNNETSRLTILSYEDYLDKFIDQEYNLVSSNIGLPRFVFRTPDMQYGLVPAPDKAYTVVYEYYRINSDLSNVTDVPTIPEQFRSIITDGAMYYAYLFRGNTQDATLTLDKFKKGIEQMRTIYINRTDYVRTTAINRSRSYGNFMRIS
jgi:hypothetical protein